MTRVIHEGGATDVADEARDAGEADEAVDQPVVVAGIAARDLTPDMFGATNRLMTEVGALAERPDVRMHTHLIGDSADEQCCIDLHGCRPVAPRPIRSRRGCGAVRPQ